MSFLAEGYIINIAKPYHYRWGHSTAGCSPCDGIMSKLTMDFVDIYCFIKRRLLKSFLQALMMMRTGGYYLSSNILGNQS
jgi:hypothetical protein